MEVIDKLIKLLNLDNKNKINMEGLLNYIFEKKPESIDIYLHILRQSNKPDNLLTSLGVKNIVLNSFPIEYCAYFDKLQAEEYLRGKSGK